MSTTRSEYFKVQVSLENQGKEANKYDIYFASDIFKKFTNLDAAEKSLLLHAISEKIAKVKQITDNRTNGNYYIDSVDQQIINGEMQITVKVAKINDERAKFENISYSLEEILKESLPSYLVDSSSIPLSSPPNELKERLSDASPAIRQFRSAAEGGLRGAAKAGRTIKTAWDKSVSPSQSNTPGLAVVGVSVDSAERESQSNSDLQDSKTEPFSKSALLKYQLQLNILDKQLDKIKLDFLEMPNISKLKENTTLLDKITDKRKEIQSALSTLLEKTKQSEGLAGLKTKLQLYRDETTPFVLRDKIDNLFAEQKEFIKNYKESLDSKKTAEAARKAAETEAKKNLYNKIESILTENISSWQKQSSKRILPDGIKEMINIINPPPKKSNLFSISSLFSKKEVTPLAKRSTLSDEEINTRLEQFQRISAARLSKKSGFFRKRSEKTNKLYTHLKSMSLQDIDSIKATTGELNTLESSLKPNRSSIKPTKQG